ncbi:MAG: 16S rRNA (cytidine(1402)-2'-O)-methyltransferase [Nitrospira sp.]
MRPEQSQGKCGSTGSLPATLFIVGVPIGHPDDLTIRALATFRRVGLIATKNPRATQALLAHHGIHTTLTTYDRVNAAEKVPILLGRLKQGTHIALVSDCGMPVVYDPGRLLITAAARLEIPIEIIPGISAVVTAAAVAGMDGNAFVFEGRWSGGVRDLERRIESLKTESRTMIFFPPARALRQILGLLLTILGNRRVVVAADLTCKTQQIVRGRVQKILTNCPFENGSIQVTLIVEGMRTRLKKHRECGST